MGSLDVKSDEKVSEQEREVANNEGESMVDSPTTSDENDDLLELISEHTSASDSESMIYSPALNEEIASSSSSTSSSDFLLEDPFQQSDLSHGETKNKGTIESPPIQTMERLSSTPPKYKIPSSIFSRKESGIDGWGMPSNESLFSINMGSINLRNQDSISWRSGELDLGFGIEPSPSDKRMMVGMIPELDETSESDGSEKNLEQDEGGRHHKLGEEDKIQSLSEIGNTHGSRIADQEDQGGKAVVEEPNSHFSAENVGSRSSFAFPILTAETNKSPSASEKSEPQLDTTPHSEPQPESDKQTEPPKAADPPATTWTNCFGCCTICS
ncbi:hypothetical protein HanXRQr2_Chr02g0061791 [Helianthus annuus]|uniref:Uncharacterized protein n=2 Tax=Helianthus annuus TaxID=4232 RepID=A0A9K3NYN9_HELAN|nr:uncharacterized protein LOC110919118 isoform X1 [Helianthus annuus]XP_022019093.1 uncharacterized protein LOC110919118 isoform X1 [Helianthus annuus]KAF5818167.1 hypothetical protein HanXRQr2_Chr02g0061791 [Helianthus annuus]KAJ0604513.1 hypothetical protein HanHA300_Chr02g0050891 [Helianthus annuus]KAJ0615011.1 hypothetical protein HanIR_Chr02g0069121 [Helianthus annuus]KAJ0951498.1 hypothetical protein HanPSC8_Chr02g0060781 [Helianthus annuus]